MTLEAEHVQDPSVAPIDHQPASQTPPVWRGLPVQMQLPPHTGPVKVIPASHPFTSMLYQGRALQNVSSGMSTEDGYAYLNCKQGHAVKMMLCQSLRKLFGSAPAGLPQTEVACCS